MILNLKEVFLQEGSKKAFEYSFSMSDIDISGVYPFVSPIMVKGEALNRAGLVDVNFDVSLPTTVLVTDVLRMLVEN